MWRTIRYYGSDWKRIKKAIAIYLYITNTLETDEN